MPIALLRLDIAGGHGACSAALCERYAGLHSTIVDLEGSVRVGQKIARENGYADKITWKAGDAFTTELGRKEIELIKNVLGASEIIRLSSVQQRQPEDRPALVE